MRTTLAAVLLVFLCTKNAIATEELELAPNQKQALGINTAPLPAKSTGELAGIPAQVVIPGNQLFIISTPLPAMVEQTLVGVGDHVHKGQLLARLQSPALAEAQRDYLQASTQEQLAKGNFTRDEQLLKDGIIAESRFSAAQSKYTEASAALAESRQMLLLAGMSGNAITRLQSGENLNSLLEITSPITGVILEKTASAGQRLESANPIFKVARLQPLGLEIQAPLGSSQDIRVGAAVSIPAYAASGKITAVGHGLSDSNQTLLLRALVHQGAQNLRPGQHVEVSIAIRSAGKDQWNVPNGALARVRGQSMVFVESPKGFRAEAVTVLHEGAQSTLITGKLDGKEKIAISGVAVLKAKLMGIGGGE